MLKQEDIDLIRELYLQGYNQKDICQKTGFSSPTIKKYLGDLSKSAKKEMIGKTFGNLLVLSEAPKNPNYANRCIRYICRCVCGNIVEVNGGALRSGHTFSCGCSRKGKDVKDLTGQKFGMLTVIDLAFINKNHCAVWNCICDCGKTAQVSSHELLGNDTKSCGCIKKSLGEKIIEDVLKEMGLNYIPQFKFKNCKNINPLPFDFAILDNNNNLICLIEYQGDIHFITTGGWNTEQALKERQERDRIKKEYCLKNKIKLIEIPYTDFNKINKQYLERKIYD